MFQSQKKTHSFEHYFDKLIQLSCAYDNTFVLYGTSSFYRNLKIVHVTAEGKILFEQEKGRTSPLKFLMTNPY